MRTTLFLLCVVCVARSQGTLNGSSTVSGLAGSGTRCVTVSNAGVLSVFSQTCPTIPSVTDVLSGDGSGNAADSGITSANLALLDGSRFLTKFGGGGSVSSYGTNINPMIQYQSVNETFQSGTSNLNPVNNNYGDLRCPYTGTAISDAGWTAGAAGSYGFVTCLNVRQTYNPSTNHDNHAGTIAGIVAGSESNSTTVLAKLGGGVFYSIRDDDGTGSTNGIFGVAGYAMAGTGANVVQGDGAHGGLFYGLCVSCFMNASAYTLTTIDNLSHTDGLIARAVYGNGFGNVVSVETAGAVVTGVVLTGASNTGLQQSDALVIAPAEGINSGSVATQLGNNFGAKALDFSGALNINSPLWTGAGTVHLGGDVEFSGGVAGNINVSAVSAPTISSVTPKTASNKTFTYRIAAAFGDGTTSAASGAVSTATGQDDLTLTNNYNTISWSRIEGSAAGYCVWRTVAGGAITSSTGLIALVSPLIYPYTTSGATAILYPTPGITGPYYRDAGVAAPQTIAGCPASPPTANSTGAITSSTYNYIASETGASNNAIAGTLTGVSLLSGLRVTVLLAHTLQSGANTFTYNGGPALAIKSHRNPANDIAAGYTSGSVITLVYDGTLWEDDSQ